MFKLKVSLIVAMCFMFVMNAHALTLSDAEAVFNNYDKDISNLQKSITMFEQVAKESGDPKVKSMAYCDESRAYLTMGDQAKLTNTDALKDYEAGKAAANNAIKADPDNAMGYFWMSANIGRIGQYKGVLNSLFMLPDFKKYLGKAYEINKTDPNILEAYGEMYYELPWIAGGSDKKALEYLNASLKNDPNFTLPMVIMGKVYIKQGEYDKAREILEKVINYKTPSYRADWLMSDKPLAQKLLNSINPKNAFAK
ncbi:MAG: tetratricopeptide repeat protein [bacterium]